MKKIYLACPYNHEEPIVRVTRFHKATKKAAELIKLGYNVFSPLSHSVPISTYYMDFDDIHNKHDSWLERDYQFIDWCDEVWVLELDGWLKSEGVQKEINYANKIGKPIVHIRE